MNIIDNGTAWVIEGNYYVGKNGSITTQSQAIESYKKYKMKKAEDIISYATSEPVYVEYISEELGYKFQVGSQQVMVYRNDLITNKDEAIAWVQSLYSQSNTNILNKAKEDKIILVKTFAAEQLSATDWKVTRHQEQVALSIQTSLTASEYQTLILDRQNIRGWSNNLEEQIVTLNTLEEVQNFTVEL